MTLPRKANQNSHFYISPALGRVAATHTRRLRPQDKSKARREGNEIVSQLYCDHDNLPACVCAILFRNETASSNRSAAARTAARRCVSALPVRSTVELRGGVAWWEQDRISGSRRQTSARTNLSAKNSGLWIREFPSATWLALQPRAKPSTSSPRKRAAIRDPRAAGFAASAPRPAPSMRSWPISSLGLNDRMVSRHRFDGIANPVIRRRTVQVALGPVCLPASDQRPSSDHSLLCAFPVAIEHTGGHEHASNLCHASAWHHHLLSDRSGALSPPFTGARHAGGVRDRGFRKGADGGSPASSNECRSESNQRQSRNGWGYQWSRKTIYRRNGVVIRRDCRAAVCARGDEPRATIPAAGYAALGRGPRNPRTLITGSGGGLAILQSREASAPA
jgi:hypothetical protein